MDKRYTKLIKQNGVAPRRIIRLNSKQAANVLEFIQTIWRSLGKPITALRAIVFRNTGIQVSGKQGPWLKVLLIVVGGVVLLYKDLRFNVNLSAPSSSSSPTLVALDDDKEQSQKVQPVSQESESFLVPTGLKAAVVLDYIDRFGKTAVGEMDQFGIPASITLAQGIIESNAGQSSLATKHNNHFGMKCFSKKCHKGHCSNHTDNSHKDFFRNYGSSWESYRAHSKLLAKGKYKVLLKHGKDYKSWAKGLSELGYATDRQYAAKLIGVIEKYKLYKYDDI